MKTFFTMLSAQIGVAVVLVCAMAGVWFFGVSAEKAILADSAEHLDSRELNLKRMDMQLGQTRLLLNTYRNNVEEIARFRREFLSQRASRVIEISKFLEATARKHRVNLAEVRYQTTAVRDGDLDSYVMELPLTGRYRDIRAFIDDVEAGEMFLVISKLRLQGGSDSAVSMQLVLTTWFEGGPS